MIEKINLDQYNLVSNYCLVKLDPAYDFKILKGPGGTEVQLKLIYTGEAEVNGYSISGTILGKPDKPFFFDKLNFNGSQREFAAMVKESTEADCDYNFKIGDKVYFNYNAQLSAESDYRILEVENHGHCMLIPYTALFGYLVEEELVPVNGYVFFKRDETPTEIKFESGIIGIQKRNPYGSTYGTVINADKPVRHYLDGHSEPKNDLQKGDRILIDKRFGYRMAYDTHAGELMGVEVIQRKNIHAILN